MKSVFKYTKQPNLFFESSSEKKLLRSELLGSTQERKSSFLFSCHLSGSRTIFHKINS